MRIQIKRPTQYVTIPTFQLYPRNPDEKASFTISLWTKPFSTGNTGYIFRRTSQDVFIYPLPLLSPHPLTKKSTDRFSLSIDTDNKVTAKVGPFNSPIVSKTTGAVLPDTSWTLITMTFILASDTKTSYLVAYFNDTVVISFNQIISLSSLTFLATDKVFLAGDLTPSDEIRFRYLYIFSPGSTYFTNQGSLWRRYFDSKNSLVPCSGTTPCQRSLGSPNAQNCLLSPNSNSCDSTCLTCSNPDPDSCLTCPSNRYLDGSSCLLSTLSLFSKPYLIQKAVTPILMVLV